MSRILILDDDDERHDWFRASWKPHPYGVVHSLHVWTARHALWGLRDPRGWDIVTLDHDLDHSHKHHYDERMHSGFRVAKAIADSADSLARAKDCRSIIHSWNPLGARAMYDAIAGAGPRVEYAPWRWDDMRESVGRMFRHAWPNPAERPPLPWEAK